MLVSWRGGPVLLAGLVSAACVDSSAPVEQLGGSPDAFLADSVTSGGATDTTTSDSTAVPTSLTLLTPEDGARIVQNDATLGCAPHQFRGYGFAIHFDWTDADSVSGLDGYYLHVQHRGSPFPMVSQLVAQSEYPVVQCNAFVIDRNADDWYWLVWVVDSVGVIRVVSDTSWFSFEPCVLTNGQRCSAPPGTAAAFAAGGIRPGDRTGVNRP